MNKPGITQVSIDEALEKTKFGKFNFILIMLSGLVLANVCFECAGISFILPVIDCDLDLSYQEKGILGATGFLGIISSSHLWGFLADTMGRRAIMRPTLIACYLASVLSSFSPNFWTFLFFRYVNGFLLSAGSATVYAYLGEFHCDKMRNRAIMGAGFVSTAAAVVYPIVAWAVLDHKYAYHISFLDIVFRPWRMFTLVLGSLGLLCGLSLYLLPESPKYLLSVGKEEEVLNVLRKVYSINTGNTRDSFEIESILLDSKEVSQLKDSKDKCDGFLKTLLRSMWIQTVPFFKREHRRNIALACFTQFWIFFNTHGLYVWFAVILNRVMQFTRANPGVNLGMCEILYQMDASDADSQKTDGECNQSFELSTFHHTFSLEVIYSVLCLGVAFFTEKIGRITTLFFILLGCGVCGVLSATVVYPLVAIYSLQVLLVCGLGATVLSSISVDIFPTHLRAMSVCLSLMFGRIGSVTGSNFFGALLKHNCEAALLTASIALILSGFVAFLLPKTASSSKTKSENEEMA